MLINIVLCDRGTSVQTAISVLRLANKILDFQIEITSNFTINNKVFLDRFREYMNNGTKLPLKHVDAFVE